MHDIVTTFCCLFCSQQFIVGDYVAVKPDDPSTPLYIGQIMYFYELDSHRAKDSRMAHIMWFKYSLSVYPRCNQFAELTD